ncbi:RNA helicase [Candidatus Tenderia electrophaga]|jgi:ATP-dependent RNA helicase RhlB|uniref:ATP-dependent RNA helicase RhlB n=1 Tax=Candidatus Tenderia electrophaga TaxID=1748243 RepID=A0A0S2TGC0_9GAMM|nr:RNA helicase [Candidatus Tenderia electrophaga]
MSNTHLSETRFADLPLVETLQSGIRDAGYSHCTPIQAKTIPLLLDGQDVAGQAQTGTGKTVAFLVATMNRLLSQSSIEKRRQDQPGALILAPTRELAVQIHKDAVALNTHTGLKLGLVYGGADYEQQRNDLSAGVDILIGTPGRIIDYFKQKIFNLRAIQAMVLDEADRMFDLGFINDIRFLLRRMPHPEKRLNMLFSATMSFRVTELAYEHMNNPTVIAVEAESVTADKVEQAVYYTANNEKIPLLIGLLKQTAAPRSIVFVNTKRHADLVWRYLEGNQIKAGLLSGDIPQKKRLRLLEEFQQGDLPVLVATDVAARGLHIPAISHVFNFDLPQNAEDYVHRIGRTARAGATGMAISFACEDYAFHLPEIEEFIDMKIPSEPVDAALLAAPAPALKPAKTAKPKHARRSQGKGGTSPTGGPRRRPRPNTSRQG